MSYDKDNIFAKILREEIPCDKIYEDDFVIAFDDIYPKAKVHFLVIPKGEYTDMADFTARASSDEIAALFKAVGNVACIKGLNDGYRIISNCGVNSGQEVPHLHIHVLGGEKLSAMVGK